MQNIIIISFILAVAAASPVLLIENHDIHYPVIAKSPIFNELSHHDSTIVDHGSFIHHPIIPVVHEISSKKSTLTKSSQVVNHGGTAVLHAPVYQSYHPVMYSEVLPSKTTVTKSNQIVNHGGTTLVHAPVYYSSPVVSLKSGDSAVSHHSSTVHETVPVVNHLPLYALHH